MKILFIFVVLLLSAVALGQTYTLDPAGAVIEIPANASTAERFAAGELARYIGLMGGKAPFIATEPAGAAAAVISLGRTAANRELNRFDPSPVGKGPDSYHLRIREGRVQLIGGSDRGTLYAVYDLLEQLGCRFLSPGADGEFVPRAATLSIPAQDRHIEPRFVQRSIDGGIGAVGWKPVDLIDWTVKNRLNQRFGLRAGLLRARYGNDPAAVSAWENRGGEMSWQWIAHNFSFIFPRTSNYFAEHPDWFALYQGQRVPLGTPERPGYGGGNLCTTNPEVIATAARFTIDWFDKNPAGAVVPMWPGDGAIKWCECPNCSALGGKNFTAGPEGSMTRRLVTFVNAVAKQVAVKHPDRQLLLPAYANYLEPVMDVPLENNILVQYCYHGCYAHGIDRCPHNAAAAEQMRQWAKLAGGRLGVWEYFLIGDPAADGGKAVPTLLPLVYRVRETMRFLEQIGVSHYFTQAVTAYQPHNPLVFYATARYAWDATIDADALIADFCRGYYGPAAEPMTRFYQAMEKATETSDWHPMLYADVAAASPRVFSDTLLKELRGRIDEARRLCGDDSRASAHVKLADEALVAATTAAHTRTAAGLDASAPWRLERQERYYRLNADGPDNLDSRRVEDIARHAQDAGTWTPAMERLLFRAAKRSVPVVFLENERLKLAAVPAIGGRLIRLIDKSSGRNYLMEAPTGDALPSIGAAYFAYGGYEEYVGKGFAGPGWEQPYEYKQENGALVMSAQSDEWRLRRTVTLDGAAVHIVSELTNRGPGPRTLSLRAHPSLTLGDSSTAYALNLRTTDGGAARSTLGREHDALATQPAGLWAAVNERENIGIAQRFDPAEASAYLFNSDDGRYFNMELLGKPRTLAAGESLRLTHTLMVLADARVDLPAVLAGGSPASRPAAAPTSRPSIKIEPKVEFVPSKIGQAALFGEGSQITVEPVPLQLESGTIAMWVCPKQSAAETQLGFLFSAGDNRPMWLRLVLHAGELSAVFKNGVAPYAGEGQFYISLSTKVPDWTAGQWRHVAFTWAAGPDGGRNNSTARLLLDGQVRAERGDLSLPAAGPLAAPRLLLGRSSADRSHGFYGLMDEVRLSSRAQTVEEIRADIEKVRRGEALAPGTGTVLLLPLDGPTTAEK